MILYWKKDEVIEPLATMAVKTPVKLPGPCTSSENKDDLQCIVSNGTRHTEDNCSPSMDIWIGFVKGKNN